MIDISKKIGNDINREFLNNFLLTINQYKDEIFHDQIPPNMQKITIDGEVFHIFKFFRDDFLILKLVSIKTEKYIYVLSIISKEDLLDIVDDRNSIGSIL